MKNILLIILIFTLTLIQTVRAQSGTDFFPVDATGIPYSIVIADISLNNGIMPDSTEIAVFDDTLCVGNTFYEGSVNQQLVAWEGDMSQGLNGFFSGNSMTFKVRLLINNDYYIIDAIPTYIQGTGVFGYGSYTVVNLAVTTSLVSTPEFEDSNSILAYPNPFSTVIKFEYPTNDFKSIEIINYLGVSILKQRTNNSIGSFSWNGKDNNGKDIPNGIYFIVFSSGINSSITKVVYQK